MQKLGTRQTQQAKLSPKQLQFVQLLQIPAEAMLARVQEEVANNPTLEEEPKETLTPDEEVSILHNHPHPQHRHLSRTHRDNDLSEEFLHSKYGTLKLSSHEKLLAQLSLLRLTPRERTIAHYIIGSLSTDGYLHTTLESITYTLSFTHYLEVDTQEVEAVLHHIHRLDPPGIGARDLRECLLLQLQRKKETPIITVAIEILTHCFLLFTKKNYRKIIATLKIADENIFKEAVAAITQCSPKPITLTTQEDTLPQRRPDFVVRKDEQDNLQVALYHDYTPTLRIRKQYKDMLKRYQQKGDQESSAVAHFVKGKIQRAQWFMESIQKRKDTLLRTMQAIVTLQKPFFILQDEQKLRPLFMRHIAEQISMDVSTISRVVSGKSVATDFGIYPLKYFFSDSMATTQGDQASTRTIKATLKGIIHQEDKHDPYTDQTLMKLMRGKGYLLARRTVAKYRGQLGLPVARMRKAP